MKFNPAVTMRYRGAGTICHPESERPMRERDRQCTFFSRNWRREKESEKERKVFPPLGRFYNRRGIDKVVKTELHIPRRVIVRLL